MTERATILCRFPNGLVLTLVKRVHDGEPLMPWGEAVTVGGPGRDRNDFVATEVDAAFAEAWFEQNALNPLVVDGTIRRA